MSAADDALPRAELEGRNRYFIAGSVRLHDAGPHPMNRGGLPFRVMPRLCERPGCSTPADVAYGFDADALVVWLDGFDVAQGSRSGVLCRRHADAMVVPLGWMLDDRREPVPRLFTAARMNDLTDGLVRPRPRRARTDRTLEMIRTAAMQLTLEDMGVTDGVVHELGPVPVAQVTDPTVAIPVPVLPLDQPEPVQPEPVQPEPVHLRVVTAVVAELPEPESVEPSVETRAEIPTEIPTEAAEMAAEMAEAGTGPEVEVEVEVEAQVLPWQPRFDQQDDLSGLLQARGRLLSRAFRGITADGA